MACVECGSDTPKYKCPACLSKYCSVACCKSHKAKGCSSDKKEKAREPVQETSLTTGLEDLEHSEDLVPPYKLAQLSDSEEVRALLHNPHLRGVLTDLVRSERPAQHMNMAMHEPLFLELADACLKVVEDPPSPLSLLMTTNDSG
ncbi:hypothetical protein ACOMHN_038319 [Nucella lapillus]